MSKKLHIVSLGCTKNLVDTEVMLGRLKDFEMTDASDEADVIIVNTCGFIDAAKQESLNTIFNLDAGRKSDSVLVMAGCLSERYKEELSKELKEVDIFTGVGDYDKIDELLAAKQSRFTPEVYLIDGAERGGPKLEFHIEPEKAGFVKLFTQVRIGGEDIFAPLGINPKITPEKGEYDEDVFTGTYDGLDHTCSRDGCGYQPCT